MKVSPLAEKVSDRALPFLREPNQKISHTVSGAVWFCVCSIAAMRLRRRILMAPRLLISSIFSWVYSLPPVSRMRRTSSVVMASMPQPKDTSCTSCISGCVVTYLAARYIRE